MQEGRNVQEQQQKQAQEVKEKVRSIDIQGKYQSYPTQVFCQPGGEILRYSGPCRDNKWKDTMHVTHAIKLCVLQLFLRDQYFAQVAERCG